MYIDFSGKYSIKGLYDTGPAACITKPTPNYLTSDNCKVINKTLHEDYIILHLQRDKDDLVGESIVKVKPQFVTRKDLLTKFFNNKEIMHRTLSELRNIKIVI